MEKDIGKIKKNDTTDIIIRVDEYKGKKGLTIREFITSERYTGFSKAGTRIPSESFFQFREMINSIDYKEFEKPVPVFGDLKKDEKKVKKEKEKVEENESDEEETKSEDGLDSEENL